jgi:hypothetical protein
VTAVRWLRGRSPCSTGLLPGTCRPKGRRYKYHGSRRPDLKHQLQGQLNSSGATSADEGVALFHVTRGRRGQVALASTGVGINPIGVARGKEGRQEGIRKIRMIDNVEEICTKLHLQPFVDRCILCRVPGPIA